MVLVPGLAVVAARPRRRRLLKAEHFWHALSGIAPTCRTASRDRFRLHDLQKRNEKASTLSTEPADDATPSSARPRILRFLPLGTLACGYRVGVDLHIVATVDAPIAPELPFVPEPPDFGNFHSLSPRKLRGDRPLWWHDKGLDVVVDEVRPDILHLKTEPLVSCDRSSTAGGCPHSRSRSRDALRSRWDSGERGAAFHRETKPPEAGRLRRLEYGRSHRRVLWARHCRRQLSLLQRRFQNQMCLAPAGLARVTTRNELQFGDDFVVGFFGRYVSEKGLAWLVDAFGEISPMGTQLACFGSGPDVSIIRLAPVQDQRSCPRLRAPPVERSRSDHGGY